MTEQREENTLEVELGPWYIHCCTAEVELRCTWRAHDLPESFLPPKQYRDMGSCHRDGVDER